METDKYICTVRINPEGKGYSSGYSIDLNWNLRPMHADRGFMDFMIRQCVNRLIREDTRGVDGEVVAHGTLEGPGPTPKVTTRFRKLY